MQKNKFESLNAFGSYDITEKHVKLKTPPFASAVKKADGNRSKLLKVLYVNLLLYCCLCWSNVLYRQVKVTSLIDKRCPSKQVSMSIKIRYLNSFFATALMLCHVHP